MTRKFITALTLMIAASGAPQAQTHTEGMTHDQTMMHDQSMMGGDPMMQANTGIPTEPGQGAFAAVSEIVTILKNDPETDWSLVNISALRDHLVDMDMLVTYADVTTTNIENGIEMTVSLIGQGGGAVSRMVPAHGPFMAAESGWQSDVSQSDDAITWRVTSPEDAVQIRALGFFGLMATGDHHRAHHIGMARGIMVH